MSERLNGIKIFIAYSHKDAILKERLEVHLDSLKNQESVRIWSDGEIIPGENWNNRIRLEMETSGIILLLISPDFLASKYIIEVELEKAMRLQKKGETEVIPIILKDCEWKEEGSLGKLVGLPENGNPVENTKYWNNVDEAFANIIKGIKKSLKQVRRNITAKAQLPSSSHLGENASNYIERSADNQLDLLLEPASPSAMYLIIGGIQCGKTSLLHRFKANAKKQNYHTIYVDFSEARDKGTFSTEEIFECIAQAIDEASINKKSGRASKKKDEKEPIHRSKETLLEYLKENLEKEKKSFLIIDAMDALLSESKEQETLNELIRWLAKVRTYQAEAPFDRLTTIAAMTTLSYSAVYYSPLRTHAANIPLWNFGHTEIENLLRIFGIETHIKRITGQIFKLFDGQPHLSHLAVSDLKLGSNLTDIRDRAFEPINGYKGFWSDLKKVLNLVLKIKNYDKSVVEVFQSLSSENKTSDDYKVIHDLFEELYRLDIINLKHEISSDFIKNAIRKEIEVK